MNNSINIWISNINKLYNNSTKKKCKFIIGSNISTHNEIVYVRRLFVDWIVANNNNFFNLREYQSNKFMLSKHIKVANDNKNNYFLIWIDFQKFLKYHGEFLLDIYSDMMKKNSRLVNLVIFSVVAVNFFYKWRKMRNDSIRKWYGYDNRRKKASNVSMTYFDNLVLNEAKSYRYYNLYKEAVYNSTMYY